MVKIPTNKIFRKVEVFSIRNQAKRIRLFAVARMSRRPLSVINPWKIIVRRGIPIGRTGKESHKEPAFRSGIVLHAGQLEAYGKWEKISRKC